MAFKSFLLLSFFLIGRPQDLIPVLQQYRLVIILTVITTLSVFLERGSNRLSPLFELKTSKAYNLFFLMMIIGIPFAYHRRVAFDSVLLSYISNMIFFYLLLLLVDRADRLEKFFKVILASIFSYSFFGLILGEIRDGRFFTYGSMFDPNDIAYVLISLFPMALFFLFRKSGIFLKALAIVAILCSIGLILLTGSRAGVLGLLVILLLVFFSRQNTLKTVHKLSIVIALIFMVSVYSNKINTDRYMTLTEISADYNVTDEFGRLQIWNRGLELFYSNPLTGVGVNCFPIAIGGLRNDIGLLPKWQTSHNSYIQVLTETGIAGFAFFIAIIFHSLKTLVRIRKSGDHYGTDSKIKATARFVEIGFIGHLFTAFFLSQGYSIFFTLFFALPLAMQNIIEGQHIRESSNMTQRVAKLSVR